MSSRKTCLITGATGGLGLELARAIAKTGATVIMNGRDAKRGEEARKEIIRSSRNDDVHLFLADMSLMTEVKQLAEDTKTHFPNLDLLINNAALLAAKRELTSEGLETMFAVNYLSGFHLTRELLPTLSAGKTGRVINISSNTHRWVDGVDFENLQAEKGFNFRLAYGAQKLMNLLHTNELATRYAHRGLTAESHHPGEVATNLGTRGPWYMRLYWKLAAGSRLSPAEAAAPIALAGVDHSSSGEYFEKGEVVTPSLAAQSRDLAQELWRSSDSLLADLC